jgi:outer membrane protein
MSRHFGWLVVLPIFCMGAIALAGPEQGAEAQERSYSLQEIVHMALERGVSVQLAETEAARTVEAIREAKSASLPSIVTGTGLAYNNGFPLSIEGSAPSIVQVGLSQPIFSSRNRNLIREAEEGSKASLAGPADARNRLTGTAVLLYNDLYEARQAIPLLEEQRSAAAASLRVVEALLQAGKALQQDVTAARVEVAVIEQQMLVMRERARLSEANLREIAGIPGEITIRTATPEIHSELLILAGDDVYRKVRGGHPSILEAEAALRAREFHLEAEKAERNPQIAIIGQYALFSRQNNYQDYFNRFTRNNYLVGLSVQLPIFDGFRTGSRVAQSRREVDAARLRLQQLESELKIGVERGVSDLRIANGAAELARLEAAAAAEKLRLSETLFEAGRIDARDLDGARAQLLAKRLAAIEAERALLASQAALLQAGGMLADAF